MEDDLKHAFKYANFSSNVNPLEMMRKILQQMELAMLKRMRVQIDARVSMLNTENDTGMDPFHILGVDINCTKAEVDAAYRDKAHKGHPDHGGTHEDMVKINAAKEAIYMYKGWSK